MISPEEAKRIRENEKTERIIVWVRVKALIDEIILRNTGSGFTLKLEDLLDVTRDTQVGNEDLFLIMDLLGNSASSGWRILKVVPFNGQWEFEPRESNQRPKDARCY